MSIIYGNVTPTFMEIYPDWKYITKTSPKKTVLKAGTPLNAQGRVASNAGLGAIGIVAEDTGVSDNPISIIVSGVVSYSAIQASYGSYSGSIIEALNSGGLRLVDAYGVAIVHHELPALNAGTVGKYLHVQNASQVEWADAPGERFTVTLTPTAEDFSGTMDKTEAEIYEAYSQGKDIWFRITAMGWNLNIRVAEANFADGLDYPSFNANTLIGPEITGSGYASLYASTGATNDGTDNTYSTHLFPLTSAT